MSHISAYVHHSLTKLAPNERLDNVLQFSIHICKLTYLHIQDYSLKSFGAKKNNKTNKQTKKKQHKYQETKHIYDQTIDTTSCILASIAKSLSSKSGGDYETKLFTLV